MSLDLKDPAELREVISVLVDAMRRSDPDYVRSHGVEHCSDEDWDTAIEAGENALEVAGVCPDCLGRGATLPNGVAYCNCEEEMTA